MTILLVLLTALFVVPDAQQAPGAAALQLGGVSVSGARRYTEADVTRLNPLKAGQPVTTSDLDAAVKQMAGTGLFASLRYRYTTAGNRMDVVFEIEEPAWSMPVMLDNFVWLTDDELTAAVRQEVPSFDGTLPVNSEITTFMSGVLQRILDARKIKGRVEFALHTSLISGKNQYLFSVKDTGLNVCSLRFTGASVIPESQLVESAAELMKREYSRLYLTELVNGTLRTMYRQKGYWGAVFQDPAATLNAPGGCAGVTATMRVSEGAPYTWERAEWVGGSVMSSKELDTLLAMKPGELADVNKIETGLRQVRTAYRQRGYIRQRSTMNPKPDESTRRLTLSVSIEEGPQFRLGELTITGMDEKDAEELRKKWRLKAGDIYDEGYASQFRSENGTPTRRLTLEPAIDPARRVVDLKIVATARGK